MSDVMLKSLVRDINMYEIKLHGITYLVSEEAPEFEQVVHLICEHYKGEKIHELSFMAPEHPVMIQLMYGYLNYLHSQNESWVKKIEVNTTEDAND
jgi:hypothetical protein